MAAQATTLQEVARAAALGVALQVALGAPFLASHPGAYVSRAFELSRAFLHTWSVNLKFLPEHVFLSPALATGLLAAHLALLWLFAEYRRAALFTCFQAFIPRFCNSRRVLEASALRALGAWGLLTIYVQVNQAGESHAGSQWDEPRHGSRNCWQRVQGGVREVLCFIHRRVPHLQVVPPGGRPGKRAARRSAALQGGGCEQAALAGTPCRRFARAHLKRRACSACERSGGARTERVSYEVLQYHVGAGNAGRGPRGPWKGEVSGVGGPRQSHERIRTARRRAGAADRAGWQPDWHCVRALAALSILRMVRRASA